MRSGERVILDEASLAQSIASLPRETLQMIASVGSAMGSQRARNLRRQVALAAGGRDVRSELVEAAVMDQLWRMQRRSGLDRAQVLACGEVLVLAALAEGRSWESWSLGGALRHGLELACALTEVEEEEPGVGALAASLLAGEYTTALPELVGIARDVLAIIETVPPRERTSALQQDLTSAREERHV